MSFLGTVLIFVCKPWGRVNLTALQTTFDPYRTRIYFWLWSRPPVSRILVGMFAEGVVYQAHTEIRLLYI